MIRLDSVTKKYSMGDETIYALKNVAVEITGGEFVAIVGPSGAGKTTLANVIGGLDRPDSGRVVVGGRDLSKEDDRGLSAYRNKTLGFVFQTFNLQPGYTALENVELPLILGRVPPRERRAKAEECLRAVGLSNRMVHRPNQLSSGQRQRVSIARALANDPEIVIADEPTGNLDSQKGAEIIALLRLLNEKKGITLIVITHDEGVASQANRVITIRDGEVC